jgi:predicted metal-dependent hydrolase
MPARLPESTHHVVLAGQRIDFGLRRSKRRSIGLSIDQRGLRVGAPLRASLRDIETLILQHGHWVIEKLTAWREREPATRFSVVDGAGIFVLGVALTVRIRAAARARWAFTDTEVLLDVPAAVDAAKVLESALRDQARSLFNERLAVYAPHLGVTPPPLRLSSARTRWGSCSARGGISLNWRLVLMPLPIVDYVVCHELAHLKEMNHSPRFWAVVEQLCPDWHTRRLELRRLGRLLPQF